MHTILVGLFSSVILVILILLTNKYHKRFSHDDDFNSIQKYHTKSTPRIGGLAIFVSFVLVAIYFRFLDINNNYDFDIIISAILVLIIGTIEDITSKTTPIKRIVITTISALSAIFITRALPIFTILDFTYLEQLVLNYVIIGICVSLFCVVGLTNSYNIIDGYNGLSATTAMINIMGICFIAYITNDIEVTRISLLLFSVILGFWIFNYPWGKIFLGDGGAYILGFIIAILSIHMLHIHKDIVSPYSFLLMQAYPITEVGFSIYRRKIIHRTKAMLPDNLHLHHLVYHNCVPSIYLNRNAYVMPLMLFFIVPPVILSIIFYRSSILCLFFFLMYIVFYVKVYFRLANFKTPKFLKILL